MRRSRRVYGKEVGFAAEHKWCDPMPDVHEKPALHYHVRNLARLDRNMRASARRHECNKEKLSSSHSLAYKPPLLRSYARPRASDDPFGANLVDSFSLSPLSCTHSRGPVEVLLPEVGNGPNLQLRPCLP